MEAALNLLREQLRCVRDVRVAIEKDDALRETDPGHRRDLLEQTQREIRQLWRAIDVLERIERGELVEGAAGTLRPPLWPRPDPPKRQTGLRPATPPDPRSAGSRAPGEVRGSV